MLPGYSCNKIMCILVDITIQSYENYIFPLKQVSLPIHQTLKALNKLNNMAERYQNRARPFLWLLEIKH